MIAPAPGSTAAASRGTILGAVILVVVLAATASMALALGAGRPRWPEAVAFAAAIAAVGGLGGWLAARLPAANPALAVAYGLGATALRIMPPLVGLAWLSDRGTPLREAGAGGLLVGFYLVLLVTGILLHIMVAPRPVPRETSGTR
jgi:hypothetical protein